MPHRSFSTLIAKKASTGKTAVIAFTIVALAMLLATTIERIVRAVVSPPPPPSAPVLLPAEARKPMRVLHIVPT